MSTLTTSKAKKQQANKPRKYRLQFLPEALKEWEGLDGSIKQPLKKLLEKRLDNPHLPGAELTRDLLGCYKIKLLKQGVRLVYRVADDIDRSRARGGPTRGECSVQISHRAPGVGDHYPREKVYVR